MVKHSIHIRINDKKFICISCFNKYFKPYIVKTQYLTFVHWFINFCNITSVMHQPWDWPPVWPKHVEAQYVFKIPLYVYLHLLVSLPALTCSGVALATTNLTRTASMEPELPPHGGRPAPNRLSHRTDLNITTELPYNTNGLVQGSYEIDRLCVHGVANMQCFGVKPGVRLVFNYTRQQDFGTWKVYCVCNVTFHAEFKYAIRIFPSPTVFVQWHFLLSIFRNFRYFLQWFFL